MSVCLSFSILHIEGNILLNLHELQVNSSSVTGNIDNLEGGLDGVMQAILCAKEVGWVDQARKVMLLATDGLLHTAGDGKVIRRMQNSRI